jgi:hypothetical protein
VPRLASSQSAMRGAALARGASGAKDLGQVCAAPAVKREPRTSWLNAGNKNPSEANKLYHGQSLPLPTAPAELASGQLDTHSGLGLGD